VIRVYVAGPLTKGDQFANVRTAVLAGEELRAAGFLAFVPHLLTLWHLITGSLDYEAAMAWCLGWLATCHAVLRLPGESSGADREVARARELGIPVYHSVAELVASTQRVA